MKSYTDLEQSKKLADILPLESADMEWINGDGLGEPFPFVGRTNDDEGLPCWSLSALLGVLPQSVRLVGTPKDSYWYCECVNGNNQWYAGFGSADNPIDACVAMIEKLHELREL